MHPKQRQQHSRGSHALWQTTARNAASVQQQQSNANSNNGSGASGGGELSGDQQDQDELEVNEKMRSNQVKLEEQLKSEVEKIVIQ